MKIYNYDNIKLFYVNESFIEEYNSWNKKDKDGYFFLAEASETFQSVGLSKQNIVIDKSKLIKIKNKHSEISDSIIKQVPSILNKPILILKSSTVKGRIVIFGEVYDEYNYPVMLAMELNPDENKKNIEKIYKVASIYGKKNIESIKLWLKDKSNILFVDKTHRTNKWLSKIGLDISSDSLFNKYIMIRDIPSDERPRERAIKYGVENLSNEELISIILKSGTKNYSVKMISSELLSNIKDISNLRNITISKLSNINGIGSVKAITLLASLELGKRVYYTVNKESIKLNNSKVIYEYFKDLFEYENQECFYAIYLDSKSKLISYKLLFKGTLNTSCVHPREIFKHAFLESAYSIIVMHNHPSGDPTPSSEDENLTSSLMKIGLMCSIPIIDHIVFGKNKYFSFYEYMHSS